MDADTDLIRVRHTRHMDEETFRKHMASRHDRPDHGPFPDLYVERCWRAYHAAIHRLSLHGDLDHDHGE
jgi:hypothetical protein